jgi:hypothetical protein
MVSCRLPSIHDIQSVILSCELRSRNLNPLATLEPRYLDALAPAVVSPHNPIHRTISSIGRSRTRRRCIQAPMSTGQYPRCRYDHLSPLERVPSNRTAYTARRAGESGKFVGNLSPVTYLREPDSRCAFIRRALAAKCTPWIRTTFGTSPINTAERSRIRLLTKLSLARISVRKLAKEAV